MLEPSVGNVTDGCRKSVFAAHWRCVTINSVQMANYMRYLSHMKRLAFEYTFSDRFVFWLFLAGIASLQLPNALTLAGALTDAP